MRLGALRAWAARHPDLWLVIAIGLLQAYFLQWHPDQPNPNETVRVYLTRAIVDDHTLTVDAQIRAHGDVEDKSVRAGSTYCDKAPGLSFAGVPLYAAARLGGMRPSLEATRHLLWLGTVWAPSLAAMLMLAGAIRRRVRAPALRSLLVVGYGLGTLAFSFSGLLFGHQASAALVTLALCLSSSTRDGAAASPRTGAWIGGLLGLALTVEHTSAIAAVAVASTLLDSRRRAQALAALAAACVPLAFEGLYNWSCFGAPWATGYSFLENPYFREAHSHGVMGITSPSWTALWGSLLSPSRGLFFHSPFLAVGFVSIPRLLKDARARREGLAIAIATVGYLAFISSFELWRSGGCVGPRHLTPLVPFLVLACTHAASRASRWKSFALRSAIAASVVLTVAASVPWPFVHESYSNPLGEVALPLWRAGQLPLSIPGLFGASPAAAGILFVLSLGAVVAGAWLRGHTGNSRVWVELGAALALASWLTAWASTLATRPVETWEEARDRAVTIPCLVTRRSPVLCPEERARRLGLGARAPTSTDAEFHAAGRAEAARGRLDEALSWYGSVARWPVRSVLETRRASGGR